jgi:hypothetical protein
MFPFVKNGSFLANQGISAATVIFTVRAPAELTILYSAIWASMSKALNPDPKVYCCWMRASSL